MKDGDYDFDFIDSTGAGRAAVLANLKRAEHNAREYRRSIEIQMDEKRKRETPIDPMEYVRENHPYMFDGKGKLLPADTSSLTALVIKCYGLQKYSGR